MSQITKNILMIRPSCFGYNYETSLDNYFQKKNEYTDDKEIKIKAIEEFNNMISLLRKHDINVVVLENEENKNLKDDIFPNNWISFHSDKYIIHSMFTKSRRKEKNKTFIESLKSLGFDYKLLNDYSKQESSGIHLEGTGSVVLDRINKVAYCSISKRSNEKLFHLFCEDIGYEPVSFKSYDSKGELIYHTNVMMSIGDDFALVCLDSIKNKKEMSCVKNTLIKSGKKLVEISLKQVDSFLGNLIQLGDPSNKIIVMSRKAYLSLNTKQKNILSRESKIVDIPIPVIESIGGGSVRCMIAELI